MSGDTPYPGRPPGPVDADYPSRVLSRLAVFEASRQLADTATALVPTGTDASARR